MSCPRRDVTFRDEAPRVCGISRGTSLARSVTLEVDQARALKRSPAPFGACHLRLSALGLLQALRETRPGDRHEFPRDSETAARIDAIRTEPGRECPVSGLVPLQTLSRPGQAWSVC